MKVILIALLSLMTIAAPQKTVYDFTVRDIDDKPVSLSQYKGKVLLIVNVASLCGNTPQYKEIEALYKKYHSKGLVVLGFPSNDFMGQEPGTNDEIKAFCSREYAVTFPLFSKIKVKGKDIAPLYAYLTQQKENGVMDAKVGWNFQKFVINRNGTLAGVIGPGTSVNKPEELAKIEKALGDK